ISAELYDYTTSIKIYDSKGASHDISIYFDRMTEDNEWEFLVTCDPSDDKRVLTATEQQTYAPETTYNYKKHKGAGALMYGELQFDTSGNISEMMAYKVPPDGEVNPTRPENRIVLENTDSYYSFETNFTGSDTNQEVDLKMGAQYEGEVSTISQTLVSEKGALDSDTSGADYITAESKWSDVYDSNGLQLTGDPAGDQDTITVTGYKHDGTSETSTYAVDSVNGKVQDFLDQLESDFGCLASIDGQGRLKMTDTTGGTSGMYVTSVDYDGTQDKPNGGIHNDANPFGETGIDGQTILNVTTPKKKIFSQGQGLSSGGAVPPVTASTSWTNVFDSGGTAIEDEDVFSFVGTSGDGTIIDVPPLAAGENEFTVDTSVTATNTGTVQDLLDWLDDKFNARAEIDGAGRLALTDRVADEAASGGYSSQLAITSVSVGSISGSDPWDSNGAFFELEADTGGEDGSLIGDTVSSGFSPEARATTQYASSSTTIFQEQNGFASGFLEDVSVDTEGVMTGHYSNGQVLEKAQVALADFASLSGLRKEGGNVYTETTDSGAPLTGVPGTNGLGTISPNSLEQSNVDLGEEFVKLITTQRGFQANSKIVTTTDEMLNTLINMKR
ncbi:MAG: flagellar hook-basal body complex protein, partial [Desulfobia sp.]